MFHVKHPGQHTSSHPHHSGRAATKRYRRDEAMVPTKTDCHARFPPLCPGVVGSGAIARSLGQGAMRGAPCEALRGGGCWCHARRPGFRKPRVEHLGNSATRLPVTGGSDGRGSKRGYSITPLSLATCVETLRGGATSCSAVASADLSSRSELQRPPVCWVGRDVAGDDAVAQALLRHDAGPSVFCCDGCRPRAEWARVPIRGLP